MFANIANSYGFKNFYLFIIGKLSIKKDINLLEKPWFKFLKGLFFVLGIKEYLFLVG